MLNDGIYDLELTEIIKALQQLITVGIATGRSIEEVKEKGIKELIEKKGFIITENGSEIYYKGKIIEEWNNLLETDFKEIIEAKSKLSKNYKVISRNKSFTITGFTNNKEIQEFKNVKIVENGIDRDFISKNAGKEEAIKFLIRKELIKKPLSCIGDGRNDLGMLKLAEVPLTVNDADKVVKELVKIKGNISSENNTKGTKEIFEKIYKNLSTITNFNSKSKP